MDILVADVDFAVLTLVSHILTSDGHKVATCADGASALQLYATHRHDLLVLDYNMPKPKGVEIIEHLRKAGDTVPILLISASIEVDLQVICDGYERVGFLPKPFTPQELRDSVTDITAKQ